MLLKHFRRNLPCRSAIRLLVKRYQILICLRKLLNPGRGESSLQMSMIAGMAKLRVVSAGSKGVMVVFNSVVAFKSSDKRHSKKFYTKLMQLETIILIVGSFL